MKRLKLWRGLVVQVRGGPLFADLKPLVFAEGVVLDLVLREFAHPPSPGFGETSGEI